METTAVTDKIYSLDNLFDLIVIKTIANLSSNPAQLRLLALNLVYAPNRSMWTGRIWLFFSEHPKNPTSYTSNFIPRKLIYIGSGGYGLYNPPVRINEYINNPTTLPLNKYGISSCDQWDYKGRPIYPVSYSCRVYLDTIPIIKLDHLLTGEKPQDNFLKIYEPDIYT